jgi:hypothetical protein
MSSEMPDVRHLFFPYLTKRMQALRRNGGKFAHYTSAQVALQIIQAQHVWMRNSLVMNDFSEVQHGYDCLDHSLSDSNIGGRFRAILNRLRPSLAEEIEENFRSGFFHRRVQSFMLCVSEHGSGIAEEDKYGRLSMWRAYGGVTNVALVFNSKPFVSESDALKAYTSPVLYADRTKFAGEFLNIVEGLENNFSALQSIGPNQVSSLVSWMFHFSVLSTKHPGFAEEREWRVIHSPTFAPSSKILEAIEVISGVPQKIYKIKLEDYPDEGFVGATLPDLLEEIIIGPTAAPWPIYDALVSALEANGVGNARSKVRVSDIPLRRQ